jgi:hypothetical protein
MLLAWFDGFSRFDRLDGIERRGRFERFESPGRKRSKWSDRGRRPGGGPRRWRRGSVVAGMALAMITSTVGGFAAVASPAGASVLLKTSGPSGEGPYPWKYPATGNITPGTGTTVSGMKCTPGTPQFASPYAAPCVPAFTGNNGGSTYRGVTSNQITLDDLVFPSTANSQEIAAEATEQGAALPQVTDQVEQVFLNYFNKVYDLYGRHVVIKNTTATGNFTSEELNQGQAQACADADTVANQVHAFGETGIPQDFQFAGTGPFDTCAVQQKLPVFFGGAYFDESTFEAQNPYVWTTTMDCERVTSQLANAIGPMLAGKKAIYAGEADLRNSVRKFGVYVPNLPDYLNCTKNFQSQMQQKYHVPASQVANKFTYGLDISTFQQSAEQAIIQFKAAHVTTVILACDPFSAETLTKEAAEQNYHPEWLLEGVAETDEDSVAQTFDQSEVDGHLFGLSELSPETETTGPNSLAGQLYQKLTGHPIPPKTDGNYSELVEIFNMLQAAGPDLTPANLARGTHALPQLGAPDYQYGLWDYNTGPNGQPGGGDHTAIADARFIYWDGSKISPDNGMKGTYVQVFNGQRYSLNWPTTLPPLFTGS